jgi:transcriptional regulator with XRE-family HTH domain
VPVHRSESHAALGRALRELRQSQKLSQEALSHRISRHRTYISRMELGQENPTFETMKRVVDELGYPMSELMARYEELDRKGRRGSS